MIKYYKNTNDSLKSVTHTLVFFKQVSLSIGFSKVITQSVTLYVSIWKFQAMFDLSYFTNELPATSWIKGSEGDA
jgi:hypothetical protein